MVNAQKTAAVERCRPIFPHLARAEFMANPRTRSDITTLTGYKLYQLRTAYATNFGTSTTPTPRYVQFGVKLYFGGAGGRIRLPFQAHNNTHALPKTGRPSSSPSRPPALPTRPCPVRTEPTGGGSIFCHRTLNPAAHRLPDRARELPPAVPLPSGRTKSTPTHRPRG